MEKLKLLEYSFCIHLGVMAPVHSADFFFFFFFFCVCWYERSPIHPVLDPGP